MRSISWEYAASSVERVDLCLLRETFWAIMVVRTVEWWTSYSLRRGMVLSSVVERRSLSWDCRSRISGKLCAESSESSLLMESEGSFRTERSSSRTFGESARSPDMPFSQSLDHGCLVLLGIEVRIVWISTIASWRLRSALRPRSSKSYAASCRKLSSSSNCLESDNCPPSMRVSTYLLQLACCGFGFTERMYLPKEGRLRIASQCSCCNGVGSAIFTLRSILLKALAKKCIIYAY